LAYAQLTARIDKIEVPVLPARLHGLRVTAAAQIAKHPWIARHPRVRRIAEFLLSARFAGYAAGSVVAFVAGNIAFVVLYLAGASTTLCSVGGFIAAAIPNWILNRRWAWRRSGSLSFGREIVGYIAVSIVVLVSTAAATGWTNAHIRWIPEHYGLRALVVTASYVAVTVVLFFAKYAIYNYWIFSDVSRVRAALRSFALALRSRNQVPRTARANRIP
jgi:putative flippase GtrA